MLRLHDQNKRIYLHFRGRKIIIYQLKKLVNFYIKRTSFNVKSNDLRLFLEAQKVLHLNNRIDKIDCVATHPIFSRNAQRSQQ